MTYHLTFVKKNKELQWNVFCKDVEILLRYLLESIESCQNAKNPINDKKDFSIMSLVVGKNMP